jgi:thioredoxin 1
MKMIKKIKFIIASLMLISCTSVDIKAQVIHNVNAAEFYKLMNSVEGIVLDVRTIDEVNEGHIKDATNLDFYASDFTDKLNLIRKDVPIFVYCRSGGRSAKVVAEMKDLGFQKVYNLLGGFGSWKSEEFNVVSEKQMKVVKQKLVSTIEFSDIIESNDVVLVDFSTQWCVPCKKMKPIIEEIKNENKDVKVVFIDADINKELIKKYKIRGVPVFIVFKNGKEIFRHVGLLSKIEIINKIK